MSDAPRRQTLLTVDDHELVRVGLRQVIVQRFADRFDLAEATSLEQALAFLQTHADRVFLLLLDLNLGDTRGLTGLQLLRKRYPQIPVVVVSGTSDPRVCAEALAQGALGYCPKTGDASDVTRLLETIERASLHATPAASTHLQPPSGAWAGTQARYQAIRPGLRLTPRQVQVLELLLSGLDNPTIAQETGLALGSVKNCVSSIYLDFNVRSRHELMRLFA